MIKEKSCGAVIVNGEEILLIKHNQGHWSFPKGHIEFGETEVETALREIKEETDLTVEIVDSIREVSTYSPREGVVKDVIFFWGLCNEKEVNLQVSEVCEYKWLTYRECFSLLTYDKDKDILKKIYMAYKSGI